MADTSFGYGQQDPVDTSHDHNVFVFKVNQILAGKYFTRVVQVIAVDPGAKTVDVQIATNQLDGQGNSSPHGTINAIPYAGGQAGTTAFKITPAAGDLGVMVVSDRDLSSVKSSKAIANPGSTRKNSAADGVYLLSILNNADPTQFFEWLSTGLSVQDINGNTIQTGPGGFVYHTVGDFVVNGVSLLNHVHGEVATGTGVSGPPVP